MLSYLTGPGFAIVPLPLVTAFAVAGLLRAAGGAGRGGALAGAAIGAGFLVTWLWLNGFPVIPPRASDKLPLLVLLGMLAGSGLAVARPARPWLWVALASVAAATAWWLVGAPLHGNEFLRQTLPGGGLALAGALLLIRLDAAGSVDSRIATVMLAMALLGLGVVAWVGGLPREGNLAFAMAAACGGFLLWNLPQARFPFGAAAVLGGGMGALVLAGQMVLHRPHAMTLPVVALALVLFADKPSAPLGFGPPALRKAMAPAFLALCCLGPVAVAILLAYVAAGR